MLQVRDGLFQDGEPLAPDFKASNRYTGYVTGRASKTGRQSLCNRIAAEGNDRDSHCRLVTNHSKYCCRIGTPDYVRNIVDSLLQHGSISVFVTLGRKSEYDQILFFDVALPSEFFKKCLVIGG